MLPEGDDPAAALAALEAAAAGRPGDGELRFAIASLHEELGRLDEAAAAYEAAARLRPMHLETYRRLFDLHLHRRALDAAWCAASVLDFFDALEGEGRDFFEDYRPRRLGPPRGSLDEAGWALLRREGEDERIGLVLRLIAPPAPTPVHETPIFAPLLARARAALGLAAGPEAAALSRDERLDARHGDRTLRELLFVAGREAAYARYPRLAALARGRTAHELAILLLAARRATRPTFAPPPPLAAEVTAAAARLGPTLGPDAREALAQAFEGAGDLRVSAWRDAVVLTGVRAGLLLAGDLRAVMRVLDAEPPPGGDLTAARQMADLAAFAASPHYVALRARLGLGVGTGADEP